MFLRNCILCFKLKIQIPRRTLLYLLRGKTTGYIRVSNINRSYKISHAQKITLITLHAIHYTVLFCSPHIPWNIIQNYISSLPSRLQLTLNNGSNTICSKSLQSAVCIFAAVCSLQSAIRNPQSAVSSPQFAVCIRSPAFRRLQR